MPKKHFGDHYDPNKYVSNLCEAEWHCNLQMSSLIYLLEFPELFHANQAVGRDSSSATCSNVNLFCAIFLSAVIFPP